jgi:hypothetical protein
MQLFFYDCVRNAQGDREIGIRDIGVFCREIIAQSLKKPKSSFTFTLLAQTPERLVHDCPSPAQIEKSLGRKRVESGIRV